MPGTTEGYERGQKLNDQEYLYLKRTVLKLTNINLDSYKSRQMRRRLDMFITRTPARNIVDYGHILEQDKEMLKEFRNFLTINVSEFFRDLSPFEQLRTVILPQLLKNTPRLNIWSAGCSHGAEPYSIAMILEDIPHCHSYRILATDIDEEVLKRAKTGGPYNPAEVKSIPLTFRRKHFASSNGDYMISDRIRRKVEFKQQNLLQDKFEQGFDLLVCRNVTIYFTDEAKKELNQKFYHSLKEEGVLFIGGTEVMSLDNTISFKRLGPSFYQKPTASVPRVTGERAATLVRA